MESVSLSNRLIRILPDKVPQSDRQQTSLIDAAFLISGNTKLQLSVRAWEDKAREYLDHAVARTPNDLRSHVQRVHLHIDRRDAEAVYGALVDLFIVLTERGRPLRERMLNLSRPLLGEDKYGILVQCLNVGITATDAVPSSGTSLLSKGLNGTNQLVTRLNAGTAQLQDPLEEALDHLEYGQIDEARQVLETAIIKEPGRQELHYNLLEIYKSTNARESFLVMRQRLNISANHPLADAWRKHAAFFGEES